MAENKRIVRQAPVKHVVEEGFIYVKSSIYSKEVGEHINREETTTFAVPDLAGTIPAEIYVEESITKNLGNFESGRVVVGIKRPCLNNEDAINIMKDKVADQVVKHILDELKLLGYTEDANGTKK